MHEALISAWLTGGTSGSGAQRAAAPLQAIGYRRTMTWRRLSAGQGEHMASNIKAPPERNMRGASETRDMSLPLLDFSDAAVKELIRSAKKRGHVTVDQINAVLPSKVANSEQIKDILSIFGEMGVNVVETKEAEPEEELATREAQEEEAEGENELVEVQQRPVPAKSRAKDPAGRTDDPVRMYLREMSSVELLSREGEIAIAKRIETGREAMIAGLCESPLTFQAIIIWRDELHEGKVFLRDIIDLEATYAGPDAKAMPAPEIGPDGQLIVGIAVPGQPRAAAEEAGARHCARDRHSVQASPRTHRPRGDGSRRDVQRE